MASLCTCLCSFQIVLKTWCFICLAVSYCPVGPRFWFHFGQMILECRRNCCFDFFSHIDDQDHNHEQHNNTAWKMSHWPFAIPFWSNICICHCEWMRLFDTFHVWKILALWGSASFTAISNQKFLLSWYSNLLNGLSSNYQTRCHLVCKVPKSLL